MSGIAMTPNEAPYSYYDLVRRNNRHDTLLPDVDFPAPALTRIAKPIAECTIGLYISCGVYLKTDPPPGRTNDLYYRLIDRSVPLSDLAIGHLSGVRMWAEQDLN